MKHNRICILTGNTCDINEREEENEPFIFVAIQYDNYRDLIYQFGLKNQEKDFGLNVTRADEVISTSAIFCKICQQIMNAELVIVEISDDNPNVLIELGMAIGHGKKILLLRDPSEKNSHLPSDLSGIFYFNYSKLDDLLREGDNGLAKTIKGLIGHDSSGLAKGYKLESADPSVSEVERFKVQIYPDKIIEREKGFETEVEYIGKITGGFFNNRIFNDENAYWNGTIKFSRDLANSQDLSSHFFPFFRSIFFQNM